MMITVNCPKCGKSNPIPELGEPLPEYFTTEGSRGSRPCIGCGEYIDWTGDQLVNVDAEGKEETKDV